MHIQTVEWKNNRIVLIDQSALPREIKYLQIGDIKVLQQAIKSLKVRGAPALGAVAALGVYLGIKDSRAGSFREFSRALDKVSRYLASSRPTARNLFWGIERVCSVAIRHKNKCIAQIKKLILQEAEKIIREDMVSCRLIGYYGAKLLNKNEAIMTICNAGILATIDYGTALGVIYRANQDGKRIKVFACETRPVLQGARLTTWELMQRGVEVTLLCDNMAAALMKDGKIDKVITGADRIAANGDTANKIGTYNLAVLAKFHRIPFYIAAPISTFDPDIPDGRHIPIEQRAPEEVTREFFKRPIAAKGIKVFNPAFDVTPHELISAIITDRGIIKPPYYKNIKKMIRRKLKV